MRRNITYDNRFKIFQPAYNPLSDNIIYKIENFFYFFNYQILN
jgi:hypothetical protein